MTEPSEGFPKAADRLHLAEMIEEKYFSTPISVEPNQRSGGDQRK